MRCPPTCVSGYLTTADGSEPAPGTLHPQGASSSCTARCCSLWVLQKGHLYPNSLLPKAHTNVSMGGVRVFHRTPDKITAQMYPWPRPSEARLAVRVPLIPDGASHLLPRSLETFEIWYQPESMPFPPLSKLARSQTPCEGPQTIGHSQGQEPMAPHPLRTFHRAEVPRESHSGLAPHQPLLPSRPPSP